jgi:hypothetical protein
MSNPPRQRSRDLRVSWKSRVRNRAAWPDFAAESQKKPRTKLIREGSGSCPKLIFHADWTRWRIKYDAQLKAVLDAMRQLYRRQSAPPGPAVAHYTGQAELADTIQQGLMAPPVDSPRPRIGFQTPGAAAGRPPGPAGQAFK